MQRLITLLFRRFLLPLLMAKGAQMAKTKSLGDTKDLVSQARRAGKAFGRYTRR